MGKLLGMFLAFAFVLTVVAADTKPATIGTKDDDACNEGLRELVQECKQYVIFPKDPKIQPSEACCGVIQKADVPCLCSKVTKEIEKLVCMEKVMYVADFCKRPFQPGSKCGSYTVPHLGQ